MVRIKESISIAVEGCEYYGGCYELDGTGYVLEKKKYMKAKLKMSPVYYRTHFEQLTDEITESNF
ncbi:hypothetical protein KM885_17075 [Oceanobacillus caeni]|uniref:hypothetical protein n=1 Tax=Oceanobacillus caeni TaxID=405946 RepID=UPI001C23F418|nr:hypothetical protein [Oceanobacillus caeni]MBU8792463.1 hypothetical protein [Oceanobacillus caeni]